MISVKVNDSFNQSGYGTFHAGGTGELPENVAKRLEAKGLVTIGTKMQKTVPENKMIVPEADKETESAKKTAKKTAKKSTKK